MSRIEEFVGEVLEVAGLPSDAEQGEELKAHLGDLAADHEQQGLAHEEAVDRAISEFGSPHVVGQRLREVTPLRVSRRDWILFTVGTAIVPFAYFAGLNPARISPSLHGFDWLVFLLVVGGSIAVTTRRPVLGALSAGAGILFFRLLVEVISFIARPGFLMTSFQLMPVSDWVPGSLLRRWDIQFFEYLVLAVVAVTVGAVVSKVRRIRSGSQLDTQTLLAGLAHLTPFLIMGGLRWGALGVVGSTVLWWRWKDRSAFVARHALQAAAVGIGAVISQVMIYQLWWSARTNHLQMYGWSVLTFSYFLIQIVRRVFGVMAVWAAISALAGHDFRYPFARLLFGGGKWRRLKHV